MTIVVFLNNEVVCYFVYLYIYIGMKFAKTLILWIVSEKKKDDGYNREISSHGNNDLVVRELTSKIIYSFN